MVCFLKYFLGKNFEQFASKENHVYEAKVDILHNQRPNRQFHLTFGPFPHV